MNTAIVEGLLREEPGACVLKAITRLLMEDSELLRVDANERSITHCFATHLKAEFPYLHVDCEYNRDGIDPKRIRGFSAGNSSDDTNAITVYPDIIAHLRGTNMNYLVIEVKKSTNRTDRSIDLKKLQKYKTDLNYQYALFIEFTTGDTPGVTSMQWR